MGRVRVAGTGTVLAFGLALALALAGCDPQPDPTAATPAIRTGATHKAGDAKGADPDMVSAVSTGHGQPGLVDLKFKVTRRPVIGEPVQILLELVPTGELESLFARFQVADGLQLVSGAETPHFEHPAAGAPLNHTITVVPKTDGIFYVTAVVLTDSDTESVARSFSFPLIAGQGLAETPAAAPAAASTAGPKPAPARP